MILSTVFWLIALIANALHRPKFMRLLGLNKTLPARPSYLCLIVAPICAFAICWRSYGGVGIIYWMDTAALAGLIASLGLTVFMIRQHASMPRPAPHLRQPVAEAAERLPGAPLDAPR